MAVAAAEAASADPCLVPSPAAVAAAEAASAHPSLVPPPAAVPAAETASAHPRLVPSASAMPAAEAWPAPSAVPTAALGPAGRCCSAVKADGPPGKTPIAEMCDRRRRSNGRKVVGDEAAMPPAGTDGRKG
jgi:hypothetical protein